MLNKLSDKVGMNTNILKLIVFSSILIILLVLALLMKGKSTKKEVKLPEVKNETIVELMDKIKDNYSL